MTKLEWFQLDRPQKIAYLNEKFDNLKSEKDLYAKKQIEKRIFEILNWEHNYDE